jgi:hemolysin activation/secretion protein
MPWETNLLLRFSAQVSPYILCASEQFLIGGAETVRGFPRSERSGDEGQTASAEYSVPLYFIPKGLKVPFTKTSFYDALRVVMFYDWGHIRNRRVAAGENKNYYLAGAGGGLRFNLPNDFSVRFDVAAPVNIKPSNNSRTTIYIEARKMF